ncbi:MAG: LysR family transcriptional regulator [Thiolinea sp.]
MESLPEIKLLKLFNLLYQTRSVTKAAELLGQRQPTVSIWLGQLRQQLHDPLFVRTPRGMLPTPRADELFPLVNEALKALQRLVTSGAVFDPATVRREFRICMTDASHITLLPELLATVRQQAPHISLQALRINKETNQHLQRGEADLALGLIPGLDAGFYQQSLYSQDWVCLANKLHPRIRDTLTLEQYQQEKHIDIVSGTGAVLLEQVLTSRELQRPITLRLPGFLGLEAIVATTDLIATTPRHIGQTLARCGGLQLVDCPLPIPGFTVKQYWHERYHQDSGNRWLRQLVAELFQHHLPAADR